MRLVERIEWIAQKCERKRVLDMGCVEGFHTTPNGENSLHPRIVRQADSVLGIDIDFQGVRMMQHLGYDVVCADAESFVSHQQFDVVVLGHFLEHVNNVGLVLSCARKNLKDDGILIVTTANARFFGIAIRDVHHTEHVHIYTPMLLEQMLKRNGFRVIETQFFKVCSTKISFPMYFYCVFMNFFPRFAPTFGVIAEKIRKEGK